MSHFTVLIAVAKSADTEGALVEALAPFDENMEVAPYRVPMSAEDMERMAKHYGVAADPVALLPHMEDWHGRAGEIADGVLCRISTYNPDSKWDWYEVGGRWAGSLPGGSDRICAKAYLNAPEARAPFAYIDDDGRWHEKGRMGWFAMVADEKEQSTWEGTVRQHIARAADLDCDLVLVDCHI